jgi:6-phospho-3-hexuloisomerase
MTSLPDDPFGRALDELGAVLSRVDPSVIEEACRLLVGAGKVMVYGCGREALQMKGFAMRLFHLGLPVSVVGDMTAPALGAGDLFFASSGPGETTTVLTLMKVAREAGATVLLVTAQPKASATALADFTLVVPAQTMADDQAAQATSVLPMGSVFEGALFLLFEIMVLRLKDMLAVSPEAMRARHTNME